MFFKDTNLNSIIISIIWGIGLACLFRKVCKNNCIIVKAPANMDKYVEHVDNKCYKFTKNDIACN